jgi:CubicO group peptidase (beta-lactamase class C family)
MEIQGDFDTRFSAVRDAFVANFEHHDEVGAAIAVYVGGQPVVDLWGGFADGARTRPWERDTIVNIYSATKGLTATCAHMAVERGLIELDAPVARYWPEFAEAGKADIVVRDLLAHRAGLPALRDPMPPGAWTDWDWVTAALAREEPWWAPGTSHGYHAVTFGFLVGEVIRRATGKTVGEFLRTEIAEPLGLDAYIGFGPELDERVAEMLPARPPPPEQPDALGEILADPDSMSSKAFANIEEALPPAVNTRAWRAPEIPAGNGHTNARSLGRLYAALAHGEIDGVELLSRQAIDVAREEHSSGEDAVVLIETRFGLGYMLPSGPADFSPNPRAFGHPGLGGALGFADPEADLAVGYTMNQMRSETPDPRWAVIDAAYDSLQ